MPTDGNPLTQQLAEADLRIAALRHEAPSRDRQPLLPEVFQELQATMEELRVAGEEMHQQNEALAEAQEHIAAERFRYRDLFESAPDGYLVTDTLGVIHDANRAAYQLLGRGPRSLTGRPLANVVAESETRAFRQRLLTARHITDREEWEVMLRRTGAGVFPAVLTVTVIRTPKGEPAGLRWLVRDVTERRQVEDEIRLLNAELESRVAERTAQLEAALAREQDARQRQEEQAALLKTLLAAAPEGIAFLDASGRYALINPTLASWNGIPAEAHLGHPAADMLPGHWPRVEPYFRRALAGETICDVDMPGDDLLDPSAARHFRASYYPIQAGGRTLGVGAVVRDVTERRRAEREVQDDLARERTIAETLQRTLLRAVPAERFPALETATFYEAALDESLVGGDFFDAFALDDDKVALVVGDISGKGLAAAACTAEIKFALRPFLRAGLSPADALARLNDFVCDARRHGDWDRDVLVALTLAVVSPRTDEVVCAAAGAEPPLILRDGRLPQTVNTKGLLLGIESGVVYAQQAAPFCPGDTLLMATDGITEARQDGDFLGPEGLAALAAPPRAGQTLPEFGRAILEGVRAYAGGPLQDDACILLARRREVSSGPD